MKTLIAKSLAAVLIAAPIGLAASGAQAHAHLVKANPAADAAVGAPPTIQLQFSEKLEPKFSGVDLMTAKGAAVAVTSKVAGKAIEATPGAALAPGGYMVMWRVVSADGHKIKGDYSFTVK